MLDFISLFPTPMLQPGFAVVFSLDCWKKTSLLWINLPSPNHNAVKKKGKKMKRALRFYCATTRTYLSCFVSYTALPYLDCCFSPHPLLKCLAQLHSCPPRLPALSAISHIPNPNTLSLGNYSAGMTPTSILHQQFPLVCFTGNDGIKNVFGLERLVRHQMTLTSDLSLVSRKQA